VAWNAELSPKAPSRPLSSGISLSRNKPTYRTRTISFQKDVFKPKDDVDPNSSPGNYWWGKGDGKQETPNQEDSFLKKNQPCSKLKLKL